MSVSSVRAWVVFSGETDLRCLRILKPGFRHCFVILNDGQNWITLDPLSNYMDVLVHRHVPAAFDLPAWLAGRGQVLLPAVPDRAGSKPHWPMPMTCVEAVKRYLGLRKPLIITPWQLYRHLYLKIKHNV